MKKRTGILLLVFILFLIGYSGILFFVFPDKASDPVFFIPLIVLSLVITFISGSILFVNIRVNENLKLKNELNIQKELYSSLSKNNEVVSKDLPIGLIIYDANYSVEFRNDFADKIFETNILGKNISFLNEGLLKIISRKEAISEIVIFSKIYKTLLNVETKTIYLMDITDQKTAEKNYSSTRPSVIILSLENVNEALGGCELKDRTLILGRYYQAIDKWKSKFNIYGETNPNNRQTFIVTKKELDEITKDEFSLLHECAEISKIDDVDISLSIGVGTGDESYVKLGQYAYKALELANDRGGNQAVVFDGIKPSVYGGNVNTNSERTSKISTRIFAEKMVKQIQKSSSVVIMPHVNTDADALGAALGVFELCETLKTPAKILLDLNRIDATVKKIIDASSTEFIKLRQSLISESDLESFFKGKTLLIIVDHCDYDLSPSKEVYKMTDTIDVIDHHRKNMKDNINISLDYIDTNASSSVELVTQMLVTLPFDVEIPPFLATVMLLGIAIDTNNYSAHMSEKAFETCSFLMKNDADAFKVKMYRRESVEIQSKRIKLLETAQIINNKFAIVIDESGTVPRDILAKNAEALLNIDNIIAGFAIGKIEDGCVGISARSNGTFNIHTEMEKFGGGGHFNIGAAQIRDGSTIKDVANELVFNLTNKEKGEKDAMKVILIEDVKKQGKKGDIIECSPGYANYLMSRKSAIEANPANIAVLEEEKASLENSRQEELAVAKKIKVLLEESSVNIFVKTGDNGKFFGSISNKQVSEALKQQLNIDIDKRKISLPEEKIEALGTYSASIRLHKDVNATLKLEVKEDKGE